MPAIPAHVAIASREAADAYGLEVLADDVGDRHARSPASSHSRRTRRSRTAKAGGRRSRSSPITARVRSIARSVRSRADEVNLVQLVSRPLPNSPWRYRFDVVLDGHVFDPDDPAGAARAALA